MMRVLLCSVLVLMPSSVVSQDQDPRRHPREPYQLEYRAADGSISTLRKGQPSSPKGALRVIPGPRQFTVGFVIDDAAECSNPVSVEHRVNADTITVTLFDYALATCPGVLTPREYLLTVTGLKSGRYLLHVYMGDVGGPGGKTTSATPWLSVDVYPF